MNNATRSIHRRYAAVMGMLLLCCSITGGVMADSHETLALPEPDRSGRHPLEVLLQQRRSVREYRDKSLSLSDIGQLLWAAQGITDSRGLRAAPSAGALYPLELYVVAGRVDRLPAGVYHYQPDGHRLLAMRRGDRRYGLAQAALGQSWLADAAAVVVFAAVYERTARKYGERAVRYVHIETGHAAQNLFLQAGALDLDTVTVGAFNDDAVAALLQLPADARPLLLMPVGGR
ncbi:MAG: SagB/ThcOx family dehydrogenase [Gammaproteobacteria bacterium]|nr:SagB/ThcOx family dehydrogenase [Gammaproteobacteria bacterium]